MAATDAQVEGVKLALRSGAASSSTVSALQLLLYPEEASQKTCTAPGRTKINTGTSKSNPTANRKTITARPKKGAAPVVREDAPAVLSSRAKYALATETVNASLKFLTEALKAQTKPGKRALSPAENHVPSDPATPDRPKKTSQRALQPRTGNSTPVRPSPDRSKSDNKTSPPRPVGSCRAQQGLTSTASCASLAFSYLLAADPERAGAPRTPKWQLETGILALAGKMIALGLEGLAVRELRVVRRGLEAGFASRSHEKRGKGVEKETLASLLRLHLDTDIELDADGFAVAITYHFHVLKLIAAARNPAGIEEALQYLQLETPNSPADLLLRQAKAGGDKAKCAKQLEALSQTILALCPSVAQAADEAAKDRAQNPAPKAVLELQTLALRIRREWWEMAGHRADVSKEVVEPFGKCAAAFTRRCSITSDAASSYKVLARSFESLGPLGNDPSLFTVHNLLCLQAAQSGLQDEAEGWALQMLEDCSSLEENHARRAVCVIKKACLSFSRDTTTESSVQLDDISNLLQTKFTGISTDYDLLIHSLEELVRLVCPPGRHSYSKHIIRLLSLSAAFTQRYSRSYPGKNAHQVQAIIQAALRVSQSTDDLISWVTDDACSIFIRDGVLSAVAKVAESKCLSAAWTISAAAISLSRVLRVLLLRAVRLSADGNPALAFDDAHAAPAEHAVMLEWQLKYAAELAVKTKYHEALKKLLPDFLRRLSSIYSARDFPLRRARVAIIAFKIREVSPSLLPPHLFKVWHDTLLEKSSDLGRDVGLAGFHEDVMVGLSLCRAFSEGRPTAYELRSYLIDWERIIETCQDRKSLWGRIDDPRALIGHLGSIAAYLAMLGEDTTCLATQRLLVRVVQVLEEDASLLCTALVNLAGQYLELGYGEKAESVLLDAQSVMNKEKVSRVAALQYQIVQAEYLLAMRNLEGCCTALDKTRILQSDLKEDRNTHETLNAHSWHICSKYLLETGSPHQALSAAKQSVRILNTIWANLERSSHHGKETVIDASDAADAEVRELSNRVSKLQLTPNVAADAKKGNDKGAVFWPFVPLLYKALLQLSDMYTHHGLFADANYYSERAIQVVESVGSSVLLSRVRSHRSRLLTLAGRMEDAEVCLAHDEDLVDSDGASMALVERLCSRAAVREKEGALEEAKRLYEKADAVLERMGSPQFIATIERFRRDDELPKEDRTSNSAAKSGGGNSQMSKAGSRKASTGTTKETATNSRTKGAAARSKQASTVEDKAPPEDGSCHLILEFRGSILVRKALIDVQRGQDIQSALEQIQHLCSSSADSLHRRRAAFQELMRKAAATLETDVTLNVLTESTLAFPAIVNTASDVSEDHSSSSVASKKSTAVVKSNPKNARKPTVEARFGDLLQAARDSLMKHHGTTNQQSGTVQTHVDCGMLSNVNLLLSAVLNSLPSKSLYPIHAGLALDLPRVKAMRFEQRAIAVDRSQANDPEVQDWTHPLGEQDSWPGLTAVEFQADFIDIIPRSWTAVSLCLNHDASELYIARYRCRQPPLILKLPFSRHNPEGLDEEVFDYHHGKAELEEIIQLSNYSCHNPANLEVKGAKTNWWSEREALDRRLHQLLINIESIWFGGFKGVFSQHRGSLDLLQKFRESFDDILDRHLPSRKAIRGRAAKLSLDDKVLELFIGLGPDDDGCIDLDEHLADLLYFVVDMLQFSGERNAYDEIDFDSMVVEVLDALRSYHGSGSNSDTEDGHLILVLDRRLQAFPWESLPCLETASVSRVGNMLSLQERILAQRSARDRLTSEKSSRYREDCHVVKRSSGTYILNPSSDLPATQTTLEPVLSGLRKAEKSKWSGIVNEPPSEDRFTTALEDSSILLYFGHGAGSQYIRPRTVKRLDRCSEVVWLMGCSSGAVVEHGDLEPSAVPLGYLIAGRSCRDTPRDDEPGADGNICMAVVATLWDVTDKDIDRFSLALGEDWGLWPSTERAKIPTKTPKKRLIVAPSTPQQVPKTPKTPKVVNTPALAKTPGRGRARSQKDDGRKMSLVEAVSRSRDACYLRYLNGAAPVVYGVPVILDD